MNLTFLVPIALTIIFATIVLIFQLKPLKPINLSHFEIW